jgi:CRISPR/Cas system-associated exonuclease Cas4 (RecB family)
MFNKGTTKLFVSRLEAELKKSKSQKRIMIREKFIPSDLLCPRKAILMTQISGKVSDESTFSSSLYMEIGNGMHKAVVEHLNVLEILVAKEFKIINELIGPPKLKPLSGYIDAIIKFKNTDKLVLVEIKSCGALPIEAKAGHINQTALYLLLTGIKEGLIYYISRSVGQPALLQKTFLISENQVAAVAYSIALAHVCVNANYLPPILSTLNKKECTYCQFKSFCYDDIKKNPFPDLALFDDKKLAKNILDLTTSLLERRDACLIEFTEKLTKF